MEYQSVVTFYKWLIRRKATEKCRRSPNKYSHWHILKTVYQTSIKNNSLRLCAVVEENVSKQLIVPNLWLPHPILDRNYHFSSHNETPSNFSEHVMVPLTSISSYWYDLHFSHCISSIIIPSFHQSMCIEVYNFHHSISWPFFSLFSQSSPRRKPQSRA